ncbi:MAG: pilus (MSHA type) biogenesis protein MshL [Burkholderiales bacterium]|nr:pilus (MSHA type) biogenesis protein MshL [Burkholderiales bacterium]
MKPTQHNLSDLHRLPWGLSLVAVAALLLSACASKPPAPTDTQTAIDAALKAAAEKRPVAKAPDNVLSALVPPVLDRPKVSKRDARFDLVFNNASINQVFEAIAAGSRYSFVVQPGFTNMVAVNLREVTAIEALEVLRELYGFEYRVSGNRVFVEPPAMQTRIFQVAYPSSKRSGRSDTRVSSGSITNNLSNASGGGGASGGVGSSANEGSQVSTSVDTDFWKELDTALKAIVGEGDGRQIVLSQHSGVLVVRAMPKQLREVESFLKSSKLSIERQVMLEAKIVEVTLKDGYQSGINWTQLNAEGNHRVSVGADPSRINVPGSIGRQYGMPDGSIKTIVDASTTPPTVTPSTVADLIATPLSSATNGVLGMAFSTDSFYGLLSFLETQGTVQVLSSPRVAAINNQKAVLRVGTDDFFVTNISTTTTSSATGTVTTPTITAQPFFSGISLDVTPQIDAEGMVTMHVRPSVSSVSERAHVINLGTLGNFSLPLASSSVNETDTIVRVQDGYIVAIGGLMHQEQDNTKSQVPFMGDLPVVGNLFKQNNRSMKKSELVFLIKPTVIKSDSDWRQDLAEVATRLEGMSLPSHSVRERAGE